jgi:FAD/FMN-containing dehydrogenase
VYQEFIVAAQQIVGEHNVMVVTDSAQLTHEHYIDPSKAHDMHNIVDKTYFIASAVLCPREVPDVQDIMRLCNQFEMPVWPFSIGRK